MTNESEHRRNLLRKTKAQLAEEVEKLQVQVKTLEQRVDGNKSVESALRESEERLAEAIGSISDGFSFYDAEGTLVMCNQAQHNFFPYLGDVYQPGVNRKEVVHRRCPGRC